MVAVAGIPLELPPNLYIKVVSVSARMKGKCCAKD
jgi:hypothetical protein